MRKILANWRYLPPIVYAQVAICILLVFLAGETSNTADVFLFIGCALLLGADATVAATKATSDLLDND